MIKTIIRNAGALYIVQIASYLIPILEIPVLARAFGAELYGQILFCQALALSGSIMAEYGFNLNATQQVATRTETSNLKKIFSQVLVAKTIIVVPLLAVLFSAWLLGWRPITSHGLSLFLFTSAYFLAFSYSPMWYFQGLERMSAPAALDVSLRSVGLIALLITVKHQNDFYLALVILALPPFVNTTVTLGWAWITCGRIKIDLIGAIKQLREGFHFFIYRGANSLAMAVVPVVLGSIAGQQAVGVFTPAEKLIRGMVSLIQPLLLAVFPSSSRELKKNDPLSYGLALRIIAAISVVAVLSTLAGAIFGPSLLLWMLGPGFDESYPIFYWLLILAPLRIMMQSMALILLIPAGRARCVSYMISTMSLISVGLGAVLASRWSGIGMAIGLVIGESFLWLWLLNTSRQVGRSVQNSHKYPASPMRILIVTTGLKLGGAERQVMDIAERFIQRGHNVTIAYLLDGVDVTPKISGVKLFPLQCTKSLSSLLRGYYRLATLCYRWRPNVVHSHMVHANIFTRLVRIVAPMHQLICTAHNTREGGPLSVLAYRLTDRLATISTNVSAEAVEAFERSGAVSKNRMISMPNGIDLTHFSLGPNARARTKVKTESTNNQPLILTVGRLAQQKNHIGLLRAFKALTDEWPKAHLWIVGDGPLKNDLMLERSRLGLEESVSLLGSRTDVAQLMRAADVFVLSSHYEGFGLVVAEAMACGTPVVATDSGGVAEVMGDTGFLIPTSNNKAMTIAISAALKLSDRERLEITTNARQRVEEYFDIEKVVDRWLEFYRDSRQ